LNLPVTRPGRRARCELMLVLLLLWFLSFV